MVTTKPSRSQEIRSKLGHPIIDSDGHTLEIGPILLDFVEKIGGGDIKKRYEESMRQAWNLRWYDMSAEQRRYEFSTAPAWWVMPTENSLDRATASLPRLLNERMDELGIDYAVLYPTRSLVLDRIPDPEVRQIGSRAVNAYHAELYGSYSKRMTTAAAIPMHTPQVAIEELEFAVNDLGMKVAMIEGRSLRPLSGAKDAPPHLAYLNSRMDVIGLDSDYDYDPFWAKCMELNIAPASHAANLGWGTRSTSNYMFNHMATFALAHEPVAKALFMGGVTKRFPGLNIAFLEGGVGWACRLYADMVGHWVKRNGVDIMKLDPKNLDVDALMSMIEENGEPSQKARLKEIREFYLADEPAPEELDDWSHVPMDQAEEMLDLFVKPFYFGCEADDPMNAHAFNSKVNPYGARLQAVFSSDIGHWDVPDMREVVEEAYELVEDELITADDFRDFTFTNAVHLYAGMNQDFFKGTVVEEAAARELAG